MGYDLYAIACPSATICYAGGVLGAILNTTDGGSAWTFQRSGTVYDNYVRGLACPAVTTCYAVGDGGMILATTDGGSTWQAQSSGTPARLFGIACPTLSHCVAVGDGVVLTTSDGGGVWSPAAANLRYLLVGVSCGTATACYAVGVNGIIIGTTDGGATWGQQDSGTAYQLSAITSDGPSTYYAGGLEGSIYKTTGSPPTPQPSSTATAPAPPTSSATPSATGVPVSTGTVTVAVPLYMAPAPVTVGQAATLIGLHFAAHEAVSLTIDVAGPSLGSLTTDAAGSFGITRTVPVLPYGPHSVHAWGLSSGSLGTANFTIKPRLTPRPTAGAAGSRIALGGTGFGDGETVRLSWDSPAGQVLLGVVSGRNGAFLTTLALPSGTPAGQHWLYAIGQASHAVTASRVTVTL